MPTQEGLEAIKKFQATGMCQCGKHVDDHPDVLDEAERLRDAPYCSLVKQDVYRWYSLPPQVQQSGGR